MKWREATAWWLAIFFGRIVIWQWIERRFDAE